MISDADPRISITNIGTGHQLGKDFLVRALALLKDLRGLVVDVNNITDSPTPAAFCIDASTPILEVLSTISSILSKTFRTREADVVEYVRAKCSDKKSFGGLGLTEDSISDELDRNDALFLLEAWLTALNSQDRVKNGPAPVAMKLDTVRPMTLAEKILCHHTVGGCPVEGLKPGDVVRIALDWVMASELSWTFMYKTMQEIGVDSIWRNDRFWLAADHVVDPGVYHLPKVKALIDAVETAKIDYKMTEYQGVNYTIMHTEFVRERIEPGMLLLGSDSHTCSSGAVGCLAIGLGAGDVAMGLVTGEMWLKIPESIQISFIGQPLFGVGGKEIILYILKELKRNTVAADRIVEFQGPGLKHLSIDARFAIANMCAEFGAVTGIFTPDEITLGYINRRRHKSHRLNSLYFKADRDAQYAAKYTVDLSAVQFSIGIHPSPDAVVPLAEKSDMKLDGVFIGACTTTEEDLILGALVLQVGLRLGLTQAKGRKFVVPGSLPIVENLQSLGMLQIYEAAGFTQAPPGCTFCVGMGSYKGAPGEVWLSSQNRNFKNRMGTGVIGHITSAAVVAASSFSMTVTDPAPFLTQIDMEAYQRHKVVPKESFIPAIYMEPHVGPLELHGNPERRNIPALDEEAKPIERIQSKVVVLGDFIDTDALAPSDFLVGFVTDEELGKHCLQFSHPDFRSRVKDGQQVVVAGEAFGCGSSRQHAVGALIGAGVQAVIARSFAFIYARNQPNLGLLGINMSDDAFYDAAVDNAEIEINVPLRTIYVAGQTFGFTLTKIEYELTLNKGMNKAYKKMGNSIWERLTADGGEEKIAPRSSSSTTLSLDKRLSW